MDDLRPPPPYTETDIAYSNPDSHSPLSPRHLSRSTTQADDASRRSSIIYTPPYTPTDSLHGDFNPSSAQAYFESRPPLHRARSPTLNHDLLITPDSQPSDLPYLPEFANRDITTQDWATFINHVIPHHIDVSNGLVANEKMKAEVLDERMRRLTLDAPRDMSAIDAQLNNLQPSQLDLSHPDVAAVVDEWNAGFFEPRGVHIVASVVVPDPPVVLPEAVADEQPRSRRRHAGPSCASPAWEASRGSRGSGCGRDGPGHRGGYGRGGRHGGFGGNPRGEFFGPRGFIRSDDSGFHLGRIMSAEKDSFRLGPMVADKSGFRIGNMLVANEEGFKLGGMYFGNGRQPETPQGNMGPVERGRVAVKDEEAKKERQRSSSADSSSSDDTTATEESEGSLPDAGDLKASQLPVMKQSLLAWLEHPDQPVSKAAIKSLKSELRSAKPRKLEGQELADLKVEIKTLLGSFREMKKRRRALKKALMKERRNQRKEARTQRKEARREAKAARKRERKGKGREEPFVGPRSGPGPFEFTPPIPHPPAVSRSESGQVSGQVGFVPPISYPPAVPRGVPPMPHWSRMPGGFPGADSVAHAHAVSRSAEELAEIQSAHAHAVSRSAEALAKIQSARARLEAEAAQVLAEAQTMRGQAEQMRRRAHEQRDEKVTLKMLDAARECDEEAEGLEEQAGRLVAEGMQLEEYVMEMERGGAGM